MNTSAILKPILAQDIVSSLVEAMENRNVDLSKLTFMGCDGTAVNTGHVGGVIRLMELHLSKSLLWCVFLLHANELPFRHSFKHSDKATSGPSAFSRAIG